jgi:cyclopropane fatty-acyl-phospholipid synthase-like methyltransferase
MKSMIVEWGGQPVKLTWLPDYNIKDEDIVTSVHAICVQNDKIVLSKIKNRGFNYPGGHIEKGESLEEAIHREVYEEAYIRGDITYIGAIEVNHKDNPHFDVTGKYPVVGYQAFYRMDVKSCDSFLRENESLARIWVEPAEVPYVREDHDLTVTILEKALSEEHEQGKINHDNLMQMLDDYLNNSQIHWDDFYSNREKKIPFFENKPDENLVSYLAKGLLKDGNALELGCGPGRNAIYLADNHFHVDAVDLSEESLKWATERAIKRNLKINFINQNLFKLHIKESHYDLVYDSGCFHHIAPHRRADYIHLVKESLKPGGYFAITCFVENGPLGGSDISDWEVYRVKSLQGGLGFTEDKLKRIFHDFDCIEIRKMKNVHEDELVFGVDGILTAIFQKRA